MTSFDRIVQQSHGYRKIRPSLGGTSSGPTPLNLAEPIGADTLQETQDSVQRQAGQAYNAGLARGLPQDQLDRLAAIAAGKQTNQGEHGALTTIFNLLGVPGDLIRFGIMDAVPGGYNPTAQDYQDIIGLNKQAIAERDTEGLLGRSGEMRGTDQLERMGWDYIDDPQNPLDWLEKSGRFAASTVLDIGEDPFSYFTFGGAGIARATAVRSAENIVLKSTVVASKFLKNYGDDALKIGVRETAEAAGRSAFETTIAERIQQRALELAGSKNWKNATTDELIDEASGLVSAKAIQKDLLEDLKPLADGAVGPGGVSADDLFSGRAKDSNGRTTIWGEVQGEIGGIVGRKQFHNREALWADYTNHVLKHMPVRDPGAVGSIGGISFQIPGVEKTARSLGRAGTNPLTQGAITRFTRGGKIRPVARFSESTPIQKLRGNWQELRKTRGRQAAVMAVREGRTDDYLGIVSTQLNAGVARYLTSSLGITAGVDRLGGQLNELLLEVGGEELHEELLETVFRSYVHGATELTPASFGKAGANFSTRQVEDLNTVIKGMRHLQQKGDEVFAQLDPRFRALWNAADRTYTPVVVIEDVGPTVVQNVSQVHRIFEDWDTFRRTPGNAKLTVDEQLDGFAAQLSSRIGIPLNKSEVVQYLDFVQGFKRVRVSSGLENLGSTDVLRMRSLGTTARVIEEMTENGPRLRVVQDFNDIVELNDKFTALLNEYLPTGRQLKNVLETNPGALLSHWFTSVHSALNERVFVHAMRVTGNIDEATDHIIAIGRVLNRLASAESAPIEDVIDLAGRLVTAFDELAEGEIPADALRKVVADFGLNKITVNVAGADVSFPVAAWADPQFRTAIAELDDYIGRATTSARLRMQQQLIGAAGNRSIAPSDIHGILAREMETRYRRIRSAVQRSARNNVETQFAEAEDVVRAGGGDQKALKDLDDKRKAELASIDADMARLDAEHAASVAQANQAAMDSALNAKANQVIRQKPKRKVKTKATSAKENFRNVGEASSLVEEVASKRAARIAELETAYLESPLSTRHAVAVEALTLHRISQGMEQIPVSHVQRTGGEKVLDSGWAVPEPGTADVWVEYYPGFGGESFDPRRIVVGQGPVGPIPFVRPESEVGKPARTFAERFGFTGNNEDLETWWRESFVQIDFGVWKYTGDSSIPFYILSSLDAMNGSIWRNELGQVWNRVNEDLIAQSPLPGFDIGFRPVRLYGLEASGLSAAREAAVMAGYRPEVLDAITAIRRRTPIVGTGNPRQGGSTVRQVVPALELFHEMVHQKALRISGEQGIPYSKAYPQALASETLGDFVVRYRSAMVTRPRYINDLNTGGARVSSVDELRSKVNKRNAVTRRSSALATPLSEEDALPIRMNVDNPEAHAYNQRLAAELGYAEDFADLTPDELYFELSNLGVNLPEGSTFPDVTPMDPSSDELVQAFPVFSTAAIQGAGHRFHYDPGYLTWLEQIADELGLVPEIGRLAGYRYDLSRVHALGTQVEELLNQPIDRLYGGAIGWEQVPALPPDAEHVIRSAFVERYPDSEVEDPFLMMLQLRRDGNWYPDSDDFLTYNELMPDTMIGSTVGQADQLQEAARNEDIARRLAVVDAALPTLERDYKAIIGVYRANGSPDFADTGNGFWSWFNNRYPGALAGLQEEYARGEALTAVKAGKQLIERERRLYLKRLGPRPQGGDALAAWNNAKRSFRSSFGEDPEEAWLAFMRKTEGQPIHPMFTDLVEDYQASLLKEVKPGVLEKDLVAAWFGTGPLRETEDPQLVTDIVDQLARGEGSVRGRMGLADPVHGSQRRANEFAPSGTERSELAAAMEEADPDALWREAREAEAEAQRMAEVEAGGSLSDEADYEQMSGYGDEYIEGPAPKGEDISAAFLSGAGLRPKPRLMASILNGHTYVDMAQLEFEHSLAVRFLPSSFQVPGTKRASGLSVYDLEEVDAVSAANRPSFMEPQTPEGQPLKGGWREEDPTAPGLGTPGMDETVMDEFGEYARTRLDPRRMFDPSDVDRSQLVHPLPGAIGRLEETKVMLPGDRGPVGASSTGVYTPKGEGPGVSRAVLEDFANAQRRVLEGVSETRFGTDNYELAAAEGLFDDLVTEGDTFFTVINSPTINRKARDANNRIMSYVGVDIPKAQAAWDAFKLTRNPVFLQDRDLVTFFAVRRGIARISKGENMNLDLWAKVLKDLEQAVLDVRPAESQPYRMAVRSRIEPEYPKTQPTEAEILTRAVTRGDRTRAVGASFDFHDKLRKLQSTGADTVDVGRHTGEHTAAKPNLGNPFYVKGKGTSRYKGKNHPFYRQRKSGMVEAVHTDTVMGQPSHEVRYDVERVGNWEPVPYTEVRTEAEANDRFYEMLWDMLDDAEYGEWARGHLVEILQGKVLYMWGTGLNANTRAMDAQVLADAVDWIKDGWYDSQRFIPSLKPGSGRPTHTGNPYSTINEQAVAERIYSVVDYIGTEDWLAGYARRLEPFQRIDERLQEEAIAAILERNPQVLEMVFNAEVRAAREAAGRPVVPPELMPLMESMSPFLNRLGVAQSEMLDSLPGTWVETQESGFLNLLQRAAARRNGPHVVVDTVTDPDTGTAMLQTTRPGSDQAAFLDNLDTVDDNAARGYTGKDPVPLSLTFKELDEMGRDRAVALGHEVAYEMSQAWSGLARKRDALVAEIEKVRSSDLAGTATPEAKAQAIAYQQRVDQIEADLGTLTNWMDEAWKVSMTGDNSKIRAVAGTLDQKKAPKPNTPAWKTYQKALSSLPPDQRHMVEFMVDNALVAHQFESFELFEKYWFNQKGSAVKVSKSLRRMLEDTYRKAEADPMYWSQVISVGDATQMKVRQLFLDVAQLVRIHSAREPGELFPALVDKIGVGTDINLDGPFGADVLAAGSRETLPDLLASISDALTWLQSQPSLHALANLKALGMEDADLSRMGTLVEQLKLRPEERVLFQQGVQGDFVGLAGDLEDGVMRDAVQLEFYRALNRMALASDPRIGMRIFGASSDILSWWTKAATVARPTFHLRNLVGGLWNSWIAGVSPDEIMAVMPDVARYVMNRRRLGKPQTFDGDLDSMIEGLLFDGISEDNREVLNMAIRSGVMDSAFSSTLPRSTTGLHGLKAWSPFRQENRYFRGGSMSMEFIEGILRFATFKHYYDAQFPHISAQLGRNMVDMVHFDYTDLSVADETVKKLAPFWVWTSRNLPLQARQLVGNPKMLLRYEHARTAFNDNFAEWDEENREWLTHSQRWVLPFRQEDDMGNWVQLSWEPALPFTDMLELPLFKQTFDDEGYDMLGEGAFNLGLWAGWVSGSLAPQWSSIADLAVDPRDQWRQTNAPALFAPLYKMLRLGEVTPQGDVRVNPTWNALINTAMPFATEYTSLLGLPTRSPYEAGNQGFLPSDYLTSRDSWPVPRVAVQQLGRGLGLKWSSPEDTYWMYKDWEAYIEQAHFMERSMRSEPVS